MQPVMVMLQGTWADMRPMSSIFSPVSGWKAESYSVLALHSSSSDSFSGSPALTGATATPT